MRRRRSEVVQEDPTEGELFADTGELGGEEAMVGRCWIVRLFVAKRDRKGALYVVFTTEANKEQ